MQTKQVDPNDDKEKEEVLLAALLQGMQCFDTSKINAIVAMAMNEMICYECGGKNHKAVDCPNRQK